MDSTMDSPNMDGTALRALQHRRQVLAQLGQAGIRVKLTTGSPGATASMFFGPAKKGDGRISFWAGRPDPSQVYNDLFSKDAFFNAGRVEVPGFRELLEATVAVSVLAPGIPGTAVRSDSRTVQVTVAVTWAGWPTTTATSSARPMKAAASWEA